MSGSGGEDYINVFESLSKEDDIPNHVVRDIKEHLELQNPTEEEMHDELTRIYQEVYPEVRDIHIHNESVLGLRDWPSMTNFRDALEHQSHIYNHLDEGNPQEAAPEVAELTAHLYRAAYEGAQVVPEKKLSEANEARLPHIIYLITGTNAINDSEYKEKVNEINRLIYEGRRNKPVDWEESVDCFKEAGEKAFELEENTPVMRSVTYKLAILIVGGLGLILNGIGMILRNSSITI